ncbi:MAG: hypothetical protein K6T78_01845 [Alicyclobacillus sp.]|nr:hypothetical protein [Alicyclobacillus sp.]
MSTHSPASAHAAHEEHIDHQGNANLAVWCGLVALTFMTGTFVAANVYLRGWSPSKFGKLHPGLLTQLPDYAVLCAILSAILVVIAGALFVKDKWGAFRGVLALATLSYVAMTGIHFRLMLWVGHYSPQAATIYAPTEVAQFVLSAICVILLAVAGWYSTFANKGKVNAFFPVATNVWIYTALSGIVILLLENVLTVGQFAAWCGQHL